MESGVYIACFYLADARTITVGKLGRFDFELGYYFYVGSAQQNLDKRLQRHGRRHKRHHWHIDYFSSNAKMLGAMVLDGDKKAECRTAAELKQRFEPAVAGFGASDCKCGGHLFYTKDMA